MRQFLIIILLVLLSIHLDAQSDKKRQRNIAQHDTAFIMVPLHPPYVGKTIIIEVGEKARIYLSGDSIVNEATQDMTIDFVKDNCIRIITFFDSAFEQRDTVSIGFYQRLPYLEYLISQQLQQGCAQVFYKRQNAFVDTISHRRERFGGHGDRFFYLPDRRPFFGVMEISGIIAHTQNALRNYYQDYIKEGEKLASLRQE